jgi:hypothetical protein
MIRALIFAIHEDRSDATRWETPHIEQVVFRDYASTMDWFDIRTGIERSMIIHENIPQQP